MTDADPVAMQAAIAEARLALMAGEAPVGAALWRDGELLVAHNEVIAAADPTAHAEMQLLRLAGREWRLGDLGSARLYVTVEPCRMCRAACFYAGLRSIVFGAGLAEMSAITGHELAAANADDGLELRGGLCATECADLLRAWAARRAV
jgi:tRNA(Arg) A34 adenosine deaminase TadA